jgi:hypothetical protein
MSGLRKRTIAAVLFTTLSTTAWSQFAQFGQPYPAPQAGANTAQSAGANTAATAGPSGYYGTVQQVPGQFLPNGQWVPNSQPTPIGGAYRFSQIFGAVAPNYLVSPTPWFSNYALRQQLALSNVQYQNLYNAYTDAYTRYNEAVAALPVGMAVAEREGRLQALEEAFNTDVNTAVESNVTDAQSLQRFNDLGRQYQNPTPSKTTAAQKHLALTDEQQRRLGLMAYQWNQMMAKLRERAANGPAVTDQELNELRREAQRQIESTLTPQQLPIWPQLAGPYYDFTWEGNNASKQESTKLAVPDLPASTPPNSSTDPFQPSN